MPEILTARFKNFRTPLIRRENDPAFLAEYETLMQTYSCRPTPITYLKNLTQELGGAQLYVKREDLNHTGAHKANNVMGQGYSRSAWAKTRVIAETGAGQHGVATATMAAKFGFECVIYMGEEDVQRQRPNVFWMSNWARRLCRSQTERVF